jgi:ATP-dependent RNA helicase SUPV3L1/SUV3
MVTRLDRVDGDIDTLVARISHIRTWTYISHRAGWVEDGGGWQERTRDIEDRLSDALHERLTQRFVDRRAALLTRRLANDDDMLALVEKDGAVVVEGHFIGHLEGFRFMADSASAPYESKALWNAARRALKGEIARRADALGNEGNGVFAINDDLRLTWRGAPVARLTPGPTPITLRVEPLSSEFLAGPALDRVQRRLEAWLDHYLQRRLAPLARLAEATLAGAARGLAFQLVEGLGSIGRPGAEREIKALSATDRTALGKLGVRIGREAIFLPALLKPRARAARILLWAVHGDHVRLPDELSDDPLSVGLAKDMPDGFYSAIGYRVFGRLALRIDAVERVAAMARRLSDIGSFVPGPDFLALADCDGEALATVLTALGYRAEAPDIQGLVSFAAPKRHRRKGPGKAKRKARSRKAEPVVNPDSPFAKLAGLRLTP